MSYGTILCLAGLHVLDKKNTNKIKKTLGENAKKREKRDKKTKKKRFFTSMITSQHIYELIRVKYVVFTFGWILVDLRAGTSTIKCAASRKISHSYTMCDFSE